MPETSMGGVRSAFPSTLWSELSRSDAPARMDHLLKAYWRPVYAYIRTAWRKSIEDAKDLTQAFFTHMMEKGYLDHVHPDRGSLRGYLKTSLRHFVINAERHAAVRRPSGPLVHLDARPGEWESLGPVSREESPETAYDREWFQTLLETATSELKIDLAGGGRMDYYTVFQRYCLEGGEKTYRELGSELGLTESDVRHRLEYVRMLLKRILRREIREYVASEDEIDPELDQVLRE